MNRRGFLGSCLALAAAPAIVRADSMMRIARPTEGLILPLSIAGVVREIRAYDVYRDQFVSRWDIAGLVGGVMQQYHVGLTENNDSRAVGAVQGQTLYVHGARAGFANLDLNREIALDALRAKIAETGMQVQRGVLELPVGVHHARLL